MKTLLSPFIQRQRLQIVAPHLKGSVLDLGCGTAEMSQYLQPGQRYVGVEGTQPYLDFLHKHFPDNTFHMRDLDHDLLNLGEVFDTILLTAVIEHLANPEFLLQQLPAYIKPGGIILITTPSPLGDIVHRFGARLGLFSRVAVEDHEMIYNPQMMELLLSKAGIRLEKYKPFLLGGNQLFICRPSESA